MKVASFPLALGLISGSQSLLQSKGPQETSVVISINRYLHLNTKSLSDGSQWILRLHLFLLFHQSPTLKANH